MYMIAWRGLPSGVLNNPATSSGCPCSQVWKPIEEMALEGTYICSVWSNPNPSVWFKR